jgi:hypothetical protein
VYELELQEKKTKLFASLSARFESPGYPTNPVGADWFNAMLGMPASHITPTPHIEQYMPPTASTHQTVHATNARAQHHVLTQTP